ncbi:hypothetical protein FBU31_004837 [Coemansia sp. 'formosensis']|nr:hypothetical protein FBU31_004837 [Coemansia sp. 'formosensis']
MPHSRAAIAFTGGKDSVLALHLVSHQFRSALPPTEALAETLDPVVLVSFRPPGDDDDFKAHKHEWVQMQAESLGIPLITLRITADPTYEESYRRSIRHLATHHQITKLVTGDIEDVGEGFMDRAVQGTGVDLVRPLWKMPRPQVLRLLHSLNIVYVVTLTRLDRLPRPISERLLGHIVNEEYLLEQLAWYDANHEPLLDAVDLAGEFGEMHSMVRDCPLFRWQIVHKNGSMCVAETKFGSYMYLSPGELCILPKQ